MTRCWTCARSVLPPAMARFDLVVFDVDDTLLDFRRSQRAAFAQCVREAAPMVDVGKANRVYL